MSVTTGGTLDLAGNGMILNYGGSAPVATVNQWIRNGRMGITPGLEATGSVVAGTAALGMVDNALLHLASFAGQSLGGVFSQLLIQQTVAGDANLDGVVDEKDYLAVIANMGRADGQWFLGDLNGDGVVNVDDFAEVTAHLGNRVASVLGDSASEGAGGTMLVAAKSAASKGSKVQEFKSSKAVEKAKQVVRGIAKKAKGKRPRLAQRH